MIRSYNDHAANERTFLAWVRTGLSAVTLGIVIKKGSLFAVVITGASSPELSHSAQGYLSSYGGSALVGIGIAVMAGAVVRFVRTALRIDDHNLHSAGIVRLALRLLRRWREDSGPTNTGLASTSKRHRLLRRVKRINLTLVGGTDVRRIQ